MRTAIDEYLKDLEKDLFKLSDMVTTAIANSIEALKEKDVVLAKEVRRNDQLINDLRLDIEEKCIKIIATQQPVATDLRELIAILNIITELERIGDYASGSAKIVQKLGDSELVKPLIDIPRMAELSIDMIERVMKAYANRDKKAVLLINSQDDDIDELYHQVFRELVSIMIEDPRTITRSTYLLWVAHNLERTGDRVTNICERILYLITGEMIEKL